MPPRHIAALVDVAHAASVRHVIFNTVLRRRHAGRLISPCLLLR